MTTGAPTIARNANYFVRTADGNGVGQLGQRVTDLGRHLSQRHVTVTIMNDVTDARRRHHHHHSPLLILIIILYLLSAVSTYRHGVLFY
jgi:hypothetical protein